MRRGRNINGEKTKKAVPRNDEKELEPSMRGTGRRQGPPPGEFSLHWAIRVLLPPQPPSSASAVYSCGQEYLHHLSCARDHTSDGLPPEAVSTAQIILSACLSPGQDTKPKVLLRDCCGFEQLLKALPVQVWSGTTCLRTTTMQIHGLYPRIRLHKRSSESAFY